MAVFDEKSRGSPKSHRGKFPSWPGNRPAGLQELCAAGCSASFSHWMTSEYNWTVQVGGSGTVQGMGIAVDGASGAIVTGYFSGDVSFGSASLASRSNYDAFVMHVTASGTIDWAVQAGGTLKDQGLGIAGDDAGGALVTGYFSDRASFGSTSLTSRGDYDVFVMHVAASGAIDWSVQAGGVARDQGSGIAHDGAGGAFVTGFFSSDASFGSVKLTSRGDGEYDIFVMHVIKSGAIDWAVQAGGTAIDEGYGIAYDGTGGALVTGTFGGDASFGSISLTSRGTFDAFVMHVTASGAIDWAVQVGGTAEVKGSSIAHDGVGGAFVTGYFMGDAVFGLTALHSQGHSDAFVMHLTASGTIDWAVQLGGTAEVKGNGIARYGAGGALVTGFFSENLVFGLKTLNSRGGANMFVMRVTDSGAIDWAVQAGGMSMVRGQGIAHDGDVLEGRGSLVVGYFSGVVSFGSTSLRSRGALDVFVMHVAKSGAIDWAVQAGGTLDDTGLGIAHDSAGGALVTGTFHGDAWFGSTLLKSRGGYERVRSDVFVMHVTASGTIDWAIQAGGTSIDHVSGIAYDGVGGALVTGGFSGDAWFGSTSLTSRGEFDVFVMHVTASGTIDWAVQAGGSYSDEGLGIAYDGAGGALVTGHFCGDASFGSSSFASRGVFDVFVMHVTKSGAIDWAVQAGGDLDDKGHGIAHDGAGGSLVTGYFQGASSFGSTSLTSRGMYDAFVMHVAASGAIDWAVQAGGVRGGAALGSYDIAYDGAGGALVTGGFSGDAWFGSKTFHSRGEHDAFVMHVTPSGAIDWAIQAGGTANDIGYGIAHDGAGGALATGGFSGAAWFGSTSLLSRGMVDAFVMHVTASGAIDVAVQAGGRSKAIGYGVAYDGGGGGALVTGHFVGDVTFGSKMVTGGDAASCFAASIMAPLRPPLPVSEKVDLISLPPSSSPAATPTATPIRAAAPEHGPFVVTALAYSVAILMVIVFCVCCGQRWARRKQMSGRLRVPLEWMRIVMSPRASPGTSGAPSISLCAPPFTIVPAAATTSLAAAATAFDAQPDTPTQQLEVVDFSTLTMARPIGKGGFATVWMARWQGTTLAVKVLHVANENFDGSALQEVAILRRLRHPCICALFGHMRFEQQPALVLEYMAGGSLAAYLFQPTLTSNGHVQTGLHDAFSRGLSSLASSYHRLTSGARSIPAREAAPDGYTLQEAPRYPCLATPDFDKHLGFAVQLASGLCFLHSNDILHCDVKTDNALLDISFTVCKLSDFGLASLSLNQVRRTGGDAGLPWGGGTLRYLAPEIVDANYASLERGDCSSVSSKHRTLISCADRTDVYAFALLLYELMHERRAFEGMSGIDACLSAMRGQRPPISLPPNHHGFADLMQGCWAQRPEDRPNMSTVLERLEACMQAHCVRSGKQPQSVISEDHAHGHAEASSSRPTHVEASSSRPTAEASSSRPTAEASSSRPTAEASSSRPTAAPSKTDQIGEHIQRNLQFWRNLNIHQP